MPKPKLTYANVAATLALVFSMTGSAIAAHHYLITSTKQISPKVISALKGKAGPTGPQGIPGKEGSTGKEGAPGKEGKEGPQGPSHAYSATGTGTAKVSVPAGSYAISGNGLFFNNSTTGPGGGECTLEAPGLAEARWATVPNKGEEESREKEEYGDVTVSNNATVVFKSAATITERCNTSPESKVPVSASSTELTAIQVAGIN